MLRILAIFALVSAAAAAVPHDALTFAQIAAYPGPAGHQNSTGQFDVVIRRGTPTSLSAPLQCAQSAMFACFTEGDADVFKQPLQAMSDEFLQLTFTYKAKWAGQPVQTYQGKTPASVKAKLCYSDFSYQNRGWRSKNKAYPAYTGNCPFTSEAMPVTDVSTLTAPEGFTLTYEMETAHTMPRGTYFAMLWVVCTDGTVCAYETTEKQIYVQVEQYNPITNGIIATCCVISVSSVVLFLFYFNLDNYWFRKYGKSCQFS